MATLASWCPAASAVQPLPTLWDDGPLTLMTTGTTPRPWASAEAWTRFALAAESAPSALLQLGLVALDRPGCRGVAAPELGCRADGGGDLAAMRLLLGSYHGPPMPPHGGGWAAPTRRSSVACAASSPRLGVPVAMMTLRRWLISTLAARLACMMAVDVVWSALPPRRRRESAIVVTVPCGNPAAFAASSVAASRRCGRSAPMAAGTTPRPWASAGACTRFALAVESTPRVLSQLRLVALDQPGCRGVTAPAHGCRADGVGELVTVPLLLGS